MSVARRCDRCQCFYEDIHSMSDPDGKIEVSLNESSIGNDFREYVHLRTYDLCPNCYNEFRKFILMEAK